MIDHQQWAQYLRAAIDERREVQAITKQVDELSIADAYAIQAAGLRLALDAGESIIGVKLGLTSAAKQEQMGVDEPVYGWVTSSALVSEGQVPVNELIHPRAEPEIVFRLGEDLAGPGVTAGDVLDASAQVMGGIEIIDSRFEAFSFTLPDVIADNTSAARVVVSDAGIDASSVDLTTLGCVFEVDGEITGTATGAALLGDPAACVAMLANHLGREGAKIEAGWIVMAGAATDARPFGAGTVASARYSALSTVTAHAVTSEGA